jgi:hypothetical protein
VLGFRGNEKEITALHGGGLTKRGPACEEDSPREDLEGGLAGGGWWMAIGGALEHRKFRVSCKRVAFSRIRVLAKQLRS